MNFHPTVWNKVENGDRVLDVVEFVALAKAIGIDPIELLGTYIVRLQQDRIGKASTAQP